MCPIFVVGQQTEQARQIRVQWREGALGPAIEGAFADAFADAFQGEVRSQHKERSQCDVLAGEQPRL